MADISLPSPREPLRVTAAAAVSAGELRQLANGRPGFYRGNYSVSSGNSISFWESGQATIPKTTGIVLLDGGNAYWDRSARKVTYRKLHDRDFWIGTVVGDAASADETCTVNLGVPPHYDYDLFRDPANSVIVGTPILGVPSANGFGYPARLGGSILFELGSATEAQKVDLYSANGFDVANANPIVEFAFRRLDAASGGLQDLNIGIANGTHATDFDSLSQYLALHIDGGGLDNYMQSKDGTTTVAATDTTTNHTNDDTLTSIDEWWFDCRNPASCKIYRNAVQVLSGTTFNIAAATAPWYLIFHMEKTSGSGNTMRVLLDWMRARTAEQ